MNININEEKFLNVDSILLIKAYTKRLSKYQIENDDVTGKILIDLNYFDNRMEDLFKTLEIPYTIIINKEMNVLNVELISLHADVVENKGINVNYELLIDYEEKEFKEEIIEAPVIPIEKTVEVLEPKCDPKKPEKDEPIEEAPLEIEELPEEKTVTQEIIQTKEEAINTNVKDTLNEEYDKMLDESLAKRSSVVTTSASESESEFMEFFNQFEQKYLHIKKIFVGKEDALNIMKEYHIEDKRLEDVYNEDTKILTIESYE